MTRKIFILVLSIMIISCMARKNTNKNDETNIELTAEQELLPDIIIDETTVEQESLSDIITDIIYTETNNIEIKIPEYIGKTSLPEGSFIWAMKSHLNGKEIIYVSPYYYVDINEMTATRYYTPDENYWFAARPPFSNNIIPVCISTDNGREYRAINISTKEVKKIEKDDGYHNLDVDSDRRYITLKIDTPEYTVAVESGWCFLYVGKNHILIPEDGWVNEDNEKIKNMLVSGFKGTVFENDYIMEMIRNLITTRSIITKYDMLLDEYDREYKQFKYFLEKMNSFFDVNLNQYIRYYNINIYKNGFYIYDFEKIILLDIKNMKVTVNLYHKCFPSDIYPKDFTYKIRLSDDGNNAFILVNEEKNGRYVYENINTLIYKLKL